MAISVDNEQPPGKAKSLAPAALAELKQTEDQIAAHPQASESVCTLRLLFSGRVGAVLEAPRVLLGEASAIGRDPTATSVCLLEDERISRVHARILRNGPDETPIIADNASRNGVFVNGVRITEKALADGDLIRIGNSFLVFHMYASALEAEQVTDSTHPLTSAILGRAPATVRMRRTIERVGPSDASVLLLGESGTGKELAAEALHRLSSRAGGPFIAVNCAAIPEHLAESLLFGHEKGAFTGADRAQLGYFRTAHQGTLFLDEVAELSAAVQPKLLRALEKRQVIPVGATRPIETELRIIAATNRDLVREINHDGFRGDLFFRLADVTVQLPPLRERREDILFILMSAWRTNPPRLSVELVELLLLHGWPYNVRELLKIAKELQIKGQGQKELGAELVADRLAMQERLRSGSELPQTRTPAILSPASGSQIPTREELLELLQRHQGNISAIAREKDKSRMQVHRWLEARGIDRGRGT